jgi:hypothetical protein
MGTAASGNFANDGLRDIIVFQQLLEPNNLESGLQSRHFERGTEVTASPL